MFSERQLKETKARFDSLESRARFEAPGKKCSQFWEDWLKSGWGILMMKHVGERDLSKNNQVIVTGSGSSAAPGARISIRNGLSLFIPSFPISGDATRVSLHN